MTANENTGRRTGPEGRKLRLPFAARLSDCLIRFLLGAVLAGGEVLEGRAFFGLAFVGVCPPGAEGLSALLGSALGYLAFRGFVGGLRYIAAAMMVYAVALAVGEFRLYRRPWFMPAVAAAFNGMVGFVYQSAAGWSGRSAAAFAAEVALTAFAVYVLRPVFVREEGASPVRERVGVPVLAAALLITLVRVTVADTLSLGRALAVLAVMTAAWKGGVGTGAAAGVAAGLAMDLASGTPPYYTLAYALPGLVTGVLSGRGRLLAALAYLASGGVSLLWGTAEGGGFACELLAGTVLFLLLPERLLSRPFSPGKEERQGEDRGSLQAARRLQRTAEAYRSVCGGLQGAFRTPAFNDGDGARIFDRAADRVCAGCRRREQCWQRDYQTTRTALSDALRPMLERGRGEREDFPPYFAGSCVKLEAFLSAANEELAAMLHRRRYDERVRESRAAVCAQYGQLARVLEQTAEELRQEPDRRRALRPPLSALAGLAAANRAGQEVGGDVGAWFRDPSGNLIVLLCDGMGSGTAAREDSDCALNLLEKFLRAGLEPEEALSTVGDALALRGEERGGFTTVDLLRLDLHSGRGTVYKLGAAPTYLRTDGRAERLEGTALPMGLPPGGNGPDVLPLRVSEGDLVVMLSDGVTTGREDGWLLRLLEGAGDPSPRELAARILEESALRSGQGDDRTVMVLKLGERKSE